MLRQFAIAKTQAALQMEERMKNIPLSGAFTCLLDVVSDQDPFAPLRSLSSCLCRILVSKLPGMLIWAFKLPGRLNIRQECDMRM